MASHSSTFAWKIPWTEEPGGLQSMGSLESDTTERLHFPFSLSCIGEGNGNPLQWSCLENPRDGKSGGLPSMGLHRVRHDWSNAAAAAADGRINPMLIHYSWKWKNYFSLNFYFILAYSWFINAFRSSNQWWSLYSYSGVSWSCFC